MPAWYWSCWVLLAQGKAAEPPPPTGLEAILRSPLPLMVMLGVLAYMMVFRPESRRRAQHETLIQGLNKNDKVETIGGLLGTVVSVNREQDEVVLKVDESSNTRIRVRCSAVRALARDRAEAKKPGGEALPSDGNG